MAYRALDIAQYIITRCMDAGVPVSNLKLQKLLYFIQGEALANLNEPAFFEPIQAWKFGPVVQEVYSKYSAYAGMPIIERYEESEGVINEIPHLKGIIDTEINRRMGSFAWDLVDETHRPGTPWDEIYNKQNQKQYGIIPLQYIKDYFRNSNYFENRKTV